MPKRTRCGFNDVEFRISRSNPDLFSSAMSDMYRKEVPQCGALLELVKEVNGEVLAADHDLICAMTII